MHVPAKRYLCAVDSKYLSHLSEPSLISLGLQGGLMTSDEVKGFRQRSFAEDAVRLIIWDDEAKIAGRQTPPLDHFVEYLLRTIQDSATRGNAAP